MYRQDDARDSLHKFFTEWKCSNKTKEGKSEVSLLSGEVDFLVKWHLDLCLVFSNQQSEQAGSAKAATLQDDYNKTLTLDLKNLDSVPFSQLDCANLRNTHKLCHVALLGGDFFSKETSQELVSAVRDSDKRTGISLLIADAPYGCTREPWDIAWKRDQFAQCVETVKSCNPGGEFGGCVIVWFVSDQQLPDALSVIDSYKLNFRLKVWSKPSSGKSKGPRLRQHHENILIVWDGTESDLVKHIDKDDPDRYGTNTSPCI